MNPNKLRVGDILFFMDALGVPNHVAIYAGFRANTHFITHAVTDPYYSIITTRLKPDDFPYRVFRCKDLGLAAQTAFRMRTWAEHQVPFSLEKHDLHFNIMDKPGFSHPVTGGEAQRNLAQSLFAANYYRYIEYASHPSMPYFPHPKNTQGMYCSEAITAAINVEKLIALDAVKSTKETHGWVSDHTSSTVLDKLLALLKIKSISKRYRDYLESSRSKDAYQPYGELPSNTKVDEIPFLPSIAAWRSSNCSVEEFVDTLLESNRFELPLDSFSATPWAMMSYFQAHAEHWEDMGTLLMPKVRYPLAKMETDKAAWRSYVQSLFEQAQEKQNSLRTACSSQLDLLEFEVQTSPVKLRRTRSCAELNDLLAQEQEAIDLLTETTKHHSVVMLTSPTKPKTKSERLQTSPDLIQRRTMLKPTRLFQDEVDPTPPSSSGEEPVAKFTSAFTRMRLSTKPE